MLPRLKSKPRWKKSTCLFISWDTMWRAAYSRSHWLSENRPGWASRSCIPLSCRILKRQGSAPLSHLPSDTEPTGQGLLAAPSVIPPMTLPGCCRTLSWGDSQVPIFFFLLILKTSPFFLFLKILFPPYRSSNHHCCKFSLSSPDLCFCSINEIASLSPN